MNEKISIQPIETADRDRKLSPKSKRLRLFLEFKTQNNKDYDYDNL